MLAALVTRACMMQQVSVAPNEVLQQCKTMTVLEKDGRQGHWIDVDCLKQDLRSRNVQLAHFSAASSSARVQVHTCESSQHAFPCPCLMLPGQDPVTQAKPVSAQSSTAGK